MHHILFVCMGNLCRSPMAEAIFAHQLALRGWGNKVSVSSAGTSSRHQGEKADPRAARLALAKGYDRISAFRAKAVNEALVASSDLILAMDEHNLRALQQKFPATQHSKMHLLLDYAGTGQAREIPDPYYGTIQGFENVMALCEASVEGVLRRLQSSHIA
jgi:protein-tyrosine phosphatase